MMEGLTEFINMNLGSAPLGVVWDSLKAFLRGVLIQKISYAKKQSQVEELEAKERVRRAEVQYVETPSPANYETWVGRQDEYSRVLREKMEKNRLFQRQSFFGEGEQVGKALSLIIKANGPSSIVPAIEGREGSKKPLLKY